MSKNNSLQILIDLALLSDVNQIDDKDLEIALNSYNNSTFSDDEYLDSKSAINLLEVSKVIKDTGNNYILSTSFNKIRDFALECIKNNKIDVLEEKSGRTLKDDFYDRYENAKCFPSLKDHYQLTASDHYAYHILNVLCRLTGRRFCRELSFTIPTATPLIGLSEIPFFCFLEKLEESNINV